MKKGVLGEMLEVIEDVADEVKKVATGAKNVAANAQAVGPAARLWKWLQEEKSIRGAMARSVVITQVPPDLAALLEDHWRGRGLATKVVNGPPPRIPPPPPPRQKVRVPR
jgi:hypothetical protein